MNVLILYFSGTGNTEYIANKISKIMGEQNCKIEMHSIEDKFKIVPNTFDLLILGCPKYYEYPVLDFIKYIKKYLPINKKKIPTMIYGTQASKLETNFNPVEKILKKKNYKLLVSRSFQIANNMVIFSSFPMTNNEKIQSNLDKVDRELKPLLTDFMHGKNIKEKPSILARGISYISGNIFTKLFSLFGVKYSTSSDCTGCGLCARKCPKKNISLTNKKPKFGKECIFCMRCINICPNHAILYNNKQCEIYHRIVNK